MPRLRSTPAPIRISLVSRAIRVVIGKGKSGCCRAAALCLIPAARQTAIRAAYACEMSMDPA